MVEKVTTTYSIIKICNNCNSQNEESAGSCKECGMLLVGKENKAKIYRKYGDIQEQQKPKRDKTIWEIDEMEERFKIR